MRKSIGAACLLAAVMLGDASGQSPAVEAVRKAAEALGGVNRVMAIRSLRLEGYGQEALQNGGGNTSASTESAAKVE